MSLLSIHDGGHDSAAAVFDDYAVVAAVQRERLTRRKKDGGPPVDCVTEALSLAGISAGEVDVVVFQRANFPRALYKTDPIRRLRDRLRGEGDAVRNLSVAMAKGGTSAPADVLDIPAVLDLYGLPGGVEVTFANHHWSHSLPALFFSDWDDALLYTADAAGDGVNYSQRIMKNGAIDCLFGDDRWLHRPYRHDSIARGYAAVTEALGFRPLHHEGKITGLAAYGKPVLADRFTQPFHVGSDGLIASDFREGGALREHFMQPCAGQTREDCAASIQAFTEEIVLASVRRLLERHKVKRLGLAGGLFANVKLNQRLAEQCDLREVFVVPPM
ncbi:MAG TPA: carbamoyltransferase N-terminal domain-containing protein, partial [Stellaceae bacterium]|nr:carbamoyltransferase N-terminal domain-containing protein [Stellaceae bacterium]